MAADVADEPGVAPIQFTLKDLEAAIPAIHDIRAPGTLPIDNRTLKVVLRNGGAPHVLKWLNAICRDECDALPRNLIAGCCRSASPTTLTTRRWATKARPPHTPRSHFVLA